MASPLAAVVVISIGVSGLHGFDAGWRLRCRCCWCGFGWGLRAGGVCSADGGSGCVHHDAAHHRGDVLVQRPADEGELHVGREAFTDELVGDLGSGGCFIALYLFQS